MDLTQRVPLGKTGVMVGRLGLASGSGVPAASIERAYHEYGVNFFYVSPFVNLGAMVDAVHRLAPAHRDDLFIVLARPYLWGAGSFRLTRWVERWLTKLKLDWVDLLLQEVHKPLSDSLMARIEDLKSAGKVRYAGISSHHRPFFSAAARGDSAAPTDFFQVRYNAVHTGAEDDVFPYFADAARPGITVFTATCWRKLLKPRLMPAGEAPLSAADCYRFVLSNPSVDVCLNAPASDEQLVENMQALGRGPLDEQEMVRARRIGEHLYGKKA